MKFCYDCANIIKEDVEKCPFCGGDLNDAEPKEAYHLKPGITLKSGKYLVGRAIGYGGFGVTYAAFDTVLQRRVAIKEYFPSNFASRSFASRDVSIYTGDRKAQYGAGLSRFLLEARNMAMFGNELNIVSVQDFFEENNTAYIVMEYLDGITLRQYLKQVGGVLSLEEAIEIIRPVCLALTKVHKSGIVHRDISPDNIFITTANIVKLIDFGAARLSLGDKDETLSVILKPGFAPPEQYRTKSRQGAFTDIYALGATFYRMITGQMPDAAVDRLIEDELEPPSAVVGSIPKSIDAAVMKAMAPDYRARFQNAADFLRALDEGKNGIAVPAVPVIPAVPIRQAVQPDAEPQASDNSADEINAEYYEPRLISETDKTVAMEYGRNNVIENEYAGSVEPSEANDIPIDVAHFPDANFRNFVLRGSDNKTGVKIDTDGSGYLSPAEIAAVTSININSKSVADLTGIGYFAALTTLYCGNNQLTQLDVSKLTALTKLSCWNNQLTQLNVSKNTALIWLNCASNQLISLDVNKLATLTELYCYDNQLMQLNVSKNTALEHLFCNGNALTTLDLSHNTALTQLFCCSNQISNLSSFSGLTRLEELDLSYNNLTSSTDVSPLYNLTKLTSLSIKIGNNLTQSQIDAIQSHLPNCEID